MKIGFVLQKKFFLSNVFDKCRTFSYLVKREAYLGGNSVQRTAFSVLAPKG